LEDDQVYEIGIYVGTSNPSYTLWCTDQKQPTNQPFTIRVALTLITQSMAPVPDHRIQPILRPIRPNILAIYDQTSL
jgi:hypothetical protein